MILDTTQWLVGSEIQPWFGIGWISWEFSYGNAPAANSDGGNGKQFLGEIQQLGIGAILDANIGVM